jgi:hypothetical protein
MCQIPEAFYRVDRPQRRTRRKFNDCHIRTKLGIGIRSDHMNPQGASIETHFMGSVSDYNPQSLAA